MSYVDNSAELGSQIETWLQVIVAMETWLQAIVAFHHYSHYIGPNKLSEHNKIIPV